MAIVLRLLLVLCFVATTVPAPMAHADAPLAGAAQGASLDDLPPCHGGGGTDAGDADAAACCDGAGDRCDCGCGCVQASALAPGWSSGGPAAAPDSPRPHAGGAAPPPRLAPPVRPPIA